MTENEGGFVRGKVATHKMIPDGSVVQAMGENMPSVSNSRCMFC